MRNDSSFIELKARERAHLLLDDGSFRELLDPFDGIISPWLGAQGIVPQSDDGMVVAKGTIDGQPAVVIAIEGAFQGGSMGEVSGAKMAAALELAAEDNRNGIPTRAVLCLETGGVRLQEANLGLAAIADIHAAIVDLRRYTPVVGIIAGTVGCFGGMSIAAGLCSYLIVTREARLGLNGPQVIEQEAGIDEYDSRDRPFIWSMTGETCGRAAAWWMRLLLTVSRPSEKRCAQRWPEAYRRRCARSATRTICRAWRSLTPASRPVNNRSHSYSVGRIANETANRTR